MIENKDLTTCIEGLRVLVVDGDSSHLRDLTKMLHTCHYQVTKCTQAAKAVSLLQDGKTPFDIVITDSNLPDMNGFQFLETINSLEIDIPVVIMSAERTIDIAMGFIIRGACEYIEKPVIMDQIRLLWKHVVQRRMIQSKSSGKQLPNDSNESICNSKDVASPGGENNCGRSIDENGYDEEDMIDIKKPRFIWTNELQQQFVAAVAKIGYHNAVPKKIMEYMKVPGLTRSNVASHLQKYRLHIEKERKNLLLREKLSLDQGQFHSQYLSPTDTISSNNSVSHAINESSQPTVQANSGTLSVGLDTYNQFPHQSCSPTVQVQANAEISSAALDSCIPLLDQSYNYVPTEQSPTIPDNHDMVGDNSFQEIHFSTEADQSTSSSPEVLDVTPLNVEFGDDPKSINMSGKLQEIAIEQVYTPPIPWSDMMNEFPEHDYSGKNTPTASFMSHINSEYISDPNNQHDIYFDQSYGEDFQIDPIDELLF